MRAVIICTRVTALMGILKSINKNIPHKKL
jgi:hypothetical protein